ncbi:MAG: hypothetical protein KGS72_17300 [Cyanobacteria bacterium REEB67]|nr:hypothetical protein [Cyanobacteria bacterium REEB67]
MTANDIGKTIDLAGVASFASLVELLAQELGVPAGLMQGQLPNGPDAFNQLHGEIDLNSQGFVRKLSLICKPGAPLTMRFSTSWGADRALAGGVTADYYLSASVEQIMPQGRALARYVEDIFSVQDRMVTLGHGSKLASMNVSASQMEAFERDQSGSLVSTHTPKGVDNV